jgi:hypothetical protein
MAVSAWRMSPSFDIACVGYVAIPKLAVIEMSTFASTLNTVAVMALRTRLATAMA